MGLDTVFCDLLNELVLTCDQIDTITYANAAAQRSVAAPLLGTLFTQIVSPDARVKGEHFLVAALAFSCPA